MQQLGKELSLREIQLVELKILKIIHQICESHKLTYYLAAGSMLGAVRHKGFIPWDDDVDIFMPRPDFESFKSIVSDCLPSSFEFKNGEDDISLPYRFAKVVDKDVTLVSKLTKPEYAMGYAYVDIFPMDGCPDHNIKKRQLFRLHKFYSVLNNAIYTAPQIYPFPKNIICKFLSEITSSKWVCKKLKQLHQKYPYGSSSHVCEGGYTWGDLWVQKAEYFFDKALFAFEDIYIWGVQKSDLYLTEEFGDYMTPLPESERESTHQCTAYYTSSLLYKD